LTLEPAPTDSSLVLDRRQGERYPCHPDVGGHLALGKQGRVPVRRICNVSERGVGLIVSVRVETRTIVAVSFQDLARGVYHSALARVVAAAEDEDGNWILHGAFARPLPPEVLQALVDEP
jgi:hypothetical protein